MSQKPQKPEIRSRKERRKNFDPRKWASKHLKNGGGLPIRTFLQAEPGVYNLPKTMSNQDRKELGIGLDPALDKLPCDKCKKVDMLYIMDTEYVCETCINAAKQAVVSKTFNDNNKK